MSPGNYSKMSKLSYFTTSPPVRNYINFRLVTRRKNIIVRREEHLPKLDYEMGMEVKIVVFSELLRKGLNVRTNRGSTLITLIIVAASA